MQASKEIDPVMCVAIGDESRYSRTVTDADLFAFAAVSGDFDPVHMDQEYAKTTAFGQRILHGTYTLSLLSRATMENSCRIVSRGCAYKPVSIGFDRVRFLKPVFVGDTMTVIYTIEAVDRERMRSVGDCKVINQRGEQVLAAKHLAKWTRPSA